MGLPADKWPSIHFYDVRTRSAVKVNANRTTVKLKHGSTKGRGPGEYFSIIAERPEGKLVKFLSESNYEKLKKAQSKGGRVSRSSSRSRSRSSSRSRSRSRSSSRSPAFRGSRRRSSKKMRRVTRSKCNTLKSGKSRKRKSCLRSPKCAWVPRSKRRMSYCRRK